MCIRDSSKGFLLDTRQVTEQIFVLLALLVEIELHVVDAHQLSLIHI